jgi:alanyl-tRNA synthetase
MTIPIIEFASNPDKFYPTATLRKLGFERAQCTVPNDKGEPCGHNFWRHTPTKKTCGDSQCEKRYSFIGVGTGRGRGAKGEKITYAQAWEGFKR